MPLYDYECECGKNFEHFQPFKEKKLTHCLCEDNKKVKRLLSVPTIQVIERGTMTDRKLYKELDE